MSKIIVTKEQYEYLKLEDKIARLKEIATRIKALETEKKELQEPIKELLGDGTELYYDDKLIVTWDYEKDKEVFNTKGFKADNPRLYEKYTSTELGSRKFYLK